VDAVEVLGLAGRIPAASAARHQGPMG
jgi:hypothetical protein